MLNKVRVVLYIFVDNLIHSTMVFASIAKASHDHIQFMACFRIQTVFWKTDTIPWPLFVQLIFNIADMFSIVYNCINFNSTLRVTVPLFLVSFPNLVTILYSSGLLIKVLISYGYRDKPLTESFSVNHILKISFSHLFSANVSKQFCTHLSLISSGLYFFAH